MDKKVKNAEIKKKECRSILPSKDIQLAPVSPQAKARIIFLKIVKNLYTTLNLINVSHQRLMLRIIFILLQKGRSSWETQLCHSLFLSQCFSQAKNSRVFHEQSLTVHSTKRDNWLPANCQKSKKPTSIPFSLDRSNAAFFTHYNSSPGDNSWHSVAC